MRFHGPIKAVLSLLCAGCSSFEQAVTSHTMTWANVQSVGGMKIGVAYKSGDSTHIPLEVNVSGAGAITTKPTTGSSTATIRKISAELEGDTILVTITESMLGSTHNDSGAPKIVIDELAPGTYWVVYKDPSGRLHHISQLNIDAE